MTDKIEPLFSCCMDGCREECSFPADMLAVWGEKLICEDCYDELPYRDKPVDPTDEEERLAWYELPRFKPPWDDRIEALTAENERLREALTQIARLRTDLSGDFSLGSKQSDIARAALKDTQ